MTVRQERYDALESVCGDLLSRFTELADHEVDRLAAFLLRLATADFRELALSTDDYGIRRISFLSALRFSGRITVCEDGTCEAILPLDPFSDEAGLYKHVPQD